MLKFITIPFVISIAFILCICSCKEEVVNPFDIPDDITEEEVSVELDPASIAGLHANVFGKTCANSGCHDGTFEPDFRTIESSYNTLVYHPLIKNDPQNTYTFRVVPGNADQSLLIARLTYDIDGNSGIMPLVTEPDSDWLTQGETYIQNIRDWIQNGAKDISGNGQVLVNNTVPQMKGVAGKSVTWLSREDGGQGALRVSQSTDMLELYIAITDDTTPTASLSNNKIRFSMEIDGFDNAEERVLDVLPVPLELEGYNGEQAIYYHRIIINPHTYASLGQTVFFRVYVKDTDNPLTEIPTDGGASYIKTYFSYTITE